jgi:hypothetical protein
MTRDREYARSIAAAAAERLDRQAEEMAHALLADPKFREEMTALLRAAFRRAIADLSAEAPHVE